MSVLRKSKKTVKNSKDSRSKPQMFRFKNSYAKLTAIAALIVSFAAVSLAKSHSDSRFSNIKIGNFGQMDDRFYRGGRPKEKDFADLKALGIQTVIDLTDNTEKEKGYVRSEERR